MDYCQNKESLLAERVIEQNKKPDFEAFWEKQILALRAKPVTIQREKLNTPYEKTFLTYKVSYSTHDRTIVDALFSVPAGREDEKLPCVAYFHGGGGYKRIYHDVMSTGVCCFAIDVRSQGGTTVDMAEYRSGDRMGGLMSRGVLDKDNFYMKNIYLDAVRTMDVIASLPEVDPSRIVTYGVSQGGALSIVASALSGRSKKCYSLVTSYCCLQQRTESGSGVFEATHAFLRNYPEHTDTVMETLSYFDIINMVSHLKVPVSFCLALSDKICLPPYVYSAYHHANCEKDIKMYPFTPHDPARDYVYFAHNEFAAL